MEKLFIRFVFEFLAEMGVDANQIVTAFAEHQGIGGLKQERDLRDLLVERFGVTVQPVTGRTGQLPAKEEKAEEEEEQ